MHARSVSTKYDSNEGSFQRERTISYIPERSYCSDWEWEMENLWKQVKDLEIELRGQCCRRDQKDSSDNPNNIGAKSSRGGSSHWSKDRSHETMGHPYVSPHRNRHKHYNGALDAMSWTLRRAVCSPFLDKIERIEMPRHFTRSPFTFYDDKTDTVEHVSHYI